MHSSPPPAFPRLTGGLDIDVAVIGGGIAGVCSAWEIARTGRSVAVLEANRLLSGVTGHTTAKLTSQHTLIYDRIRSSLGGQAARLYAQAQQDALRHVRDTVSELAIDCDLETRPAYTYSGDLVEIQAEVAAAAEAGLPAAFVTETGLPFPVRAAIRVEDQAQFHPLRYLHALTNDLLHRGGQIFEGARVTELEPGTPCRLSTESGAVVRAGSVVVATHFPIFDKVSLVARLVPRRELVVAAPIPSSADPAGMYITQQDNTRSVRTAPYRDGQRLLIVTGEIYRPGAAGVSQRLTRLAEWTRKHFGVSELAFRWSAQDNETADGIPYVGRFPGLGDNVFVVAGFGGWGMSNGVAAGRMIAAELERQPMPWAGIFDPSRVHLRAEGGDVFRNAVAVTRHFIGDRVRVRRAEVISDIEPGTGQVLQIEGDRVAIYRDREGVAHAVSAVCTHLGCLVGFNDAESTWDCPCHGSRYGVDGRVISGPAVEPLAPHELPQDFMAGRISEA